MWFLGSHTHHLFETGEKISDVQLAAAGKYGYYVGEVHVTLDDKHRIRKTSARTSSPTEKDAGAAWGPRRNWRIPDRSDTDY